MSFYTCATGYEAEAARLRKSCDRHSVPHHIEPVDSLGSWEANCQWKADFLAAQRKRYSGPLVWLDADAEVVAYPDLFDRLDCDIAIHYRAGKELLSGTICLGDTDGARSLLAEWQSVNRAKPTRWDQRNLSDAISRVPDLSVVELPPEYCQIFDLMAGEGGEPVIAHHQASRRLKQHV